MNRLDRYIIANVLGLTAVTALGLTAIQTFIAFVSEAGELGGNFGFVELGLYIALLVPSGLLTMLPMIALLGTLLGLGALASQGELVAMRAVGVSVLRLGRATTLAGVLLGLGRSCWATGWRRPGSVRRIPCVTLPSTASTRTPRPDRCGCGRATM